MPDLMSSIDLILSEFLDEPHLPKTSMMKLSDGEDLTLSYWSYFG